jgi:iron complex transport system permease protein
MRRPLLFALLFGLLLATVLISFTLGRYPVTLKEIGGFAVHHLFKTTGMDEKKLRALKNVLLDIRLPRILAAVLVGSALAVSGAAFQSMFINPLVSPGLLGVLAGASFGAALAMVFTKSWIAVQIGALIFGLGAVSLALVVARFFPGDRLFMLMLSGIITGSFFTALVSLVKYVADPYDQLPAIVHWLAGGLSMADAGTTFALSVPIILGILVMVWLSNYLNVLTMGDEEARTLGVRVRTVRTIFIFCATLISALTVSLAGIVGWVGLVIPHIGRMLAGPDNRVLLPVTAMLGAIYLIIVDDFCRLLFQVEVPLGILTSLLGIPFFALVVRNAKKGWG